MVSAAQAARRAAGAHPRQGCPNLVDELTVTRLLRNPATLSRYKYYVARDFVTESRDLRWCPAAKCENAVRMAVPSPSTVTCSCGHSFCFGCGEGAHEPLQCPMLRLWLKKCADDSETVGRVRVGV